MGKKTKTTSLETTPDLSFVKNGLLNMVVYRSKDGEMMRIPADSEGFLEDRRIIKASSMDQVIFNKDATFKVTLDFLEPLPCVEETAVRESTDWMLCTCNGANAFYSKIEKRLVLQVCTTSLQSEVFEMEKPFIIVLLFDDDEWLVERVLR